MNKQPTDSKDTQTKHRDEQLYLASQWRLMWWKFKDHKLAYFSLYGLILLYVVAALCEFVAPNDPTKRDVLFLGSGLPPAHAQVVKIDAGASTVTFSQGTVDGVTAGSKLSVFASFLP